MKYLSSKERISFRLAARVADRMEIAAQVGEIERAVRALREAYADICEYEARIL
jgi:phosphatidylinositol kinase/protein kinase (PI-3  family)